jgi:single-strand DNA-binding protein
MPAFAQLIGRLGVAPELRFTQQGTPVVNLSLAVSRRQKHDAGREPTVDWFRVVVYGRDAETLAHYARPGSALAFNGQLRTEHYRDREGQARTATVILASSFAFLPGPARQATAASETPPPESAAAEALAEDDSF